MGTDRRDGHLILSTYDLSLFVEKAMQPEKKMSVQTTLEQRGKRYGEFERHAEITQDLKRAMAASPNWDKDLTDSMREALEMIAHKIGRILNGDPTYADSWHDISGYATLVEQDLLKIEARIEKDWLDARQA
jgi:hypothetical protein